MNCGSELAEDARFCGTCGAAVVASSSAAPPLDLPPAVKLSSPLRRLSGHLLDFILAVVTLLIGWLIWSLIVWARGQTPGKQLLGMRVIRSDTQAVVGWGRMALREVICKGVIGLVAGITVIGTVLYLWLLWDDQNQELWDKMATTLVVDDPQRVLAPP